MTQIHQRDGRAQMILVGALLLAVTLVALALVTNSVIYTENLASRDEVSTDDAVSFRQAAMQGSERAIVEANFGQDDVDYDTRFATFRQSVRDWGKRSTSFLSTSGVSGEVSSSGLTEGTRVSQDTAGNFDPASDDVLLGTDPAGLNTHETWLVAQNSKLRRFQMTVDRSSLYERPSSLTDSLFDTLFGASPFFIGTEDDDGDNYYTFVYRNPNPDPDSIEVVTYNWPDGAASATKLGECSIQADQATIDITAGQLVSDSKVKSCPALDYYDEVSGSPNTYFSNGDDVSGTYQFVADQSQTEFRQAVEDRNNDIIDTLDLGGSASVMVDADISLLNLDLSLDPSVGADDTYASTSTSGASDDPYTNTAIWSGDVGVTYVTESVSYDTSMTVAPGMPGEGSGALAGSGSSSPGNSDPTAEYSYTPSDPETGETITFDAGASSDSDGTITYAWDIDEDGDNELTGETVTHSYSSPGFYDVVLTVTDDDGATDTRTQTVQVTSSLDTAPEVQSVSTTDQSSSNGQDRVEYDVTWDVHDDDGDLVQVTVELLRDQNDNQVDSETITTIGGTDASGTATVSWESGNACGKDVYITVTVEDAAGKTDSQTTSTLSPSC